MSFEEFNLKQLLELGLRFPEVGAVNFNIIYLILKTIITRHGLENLTPEFTFAYYGESGSQEDIEEEETESSDEFEELTIQYAEQFGGVSKDLHKLNETVQELSKRISYLETRSAHSDEDIEAESETEIADEDVDKKSGEKEKELQVAKLDKIEDTSLKKEGNFKLALDEIKKQMESLKDDEKNLIHHHMQLLRATNDFIVDKFEELLQDFDTVMNGYSKLVIAPIVKNDMCFKFMVGMQVEELDKSVNKKLSLEDDLERLKEKVERLETYVYTGKYSSTEEDTVLEEKEHEDFEPETAYPSYVTGKVEVLQKGIVDHRKANFGKIVRDLIAVPVEMRAEILKEREHETGVKKIRPTMKKAYEKFIKAAQRVREVKETELKSEETAEHIPIDEMLKETEIPAEELVIEEDHEHPETARKNVQTAVQVINLVQHLRKTQEARTREKESLRTIYAAEDVEEEENPCPFGVILAIRSYCRAL
ncbi:uncharacterized protein NPIL_576694 [Nephila pilipes]|uniref:Uncharacterized protein n=1 Tax=Nephila pilipes TaxID=299642 RepID=A0A8X6MXC4_NEPPI|nr:uncharacterized protein NPIL_576694 [Nephila pilipes]